MKNTGSGAEKIPTRKIVDTQCVARSCWHFLTDAVKIPTEMPASAV